MDASSLPTSTFRHYPSPSPKESLLKRYKSVWRFFLISNLALSAYMFAWAKKKDAGTVDKKVAAEVASPSVATASGISVEPVHPIFISETVAMRTPIPEDQQRELFVWMLEEKRKVKPKDSEEKRRIDEDKATLKHFIRRAKSIPSL